MNPQQRHWLEKTQVQVTAAIAMVFAWFVCWRAVTPWEAQGVLSFLPDGAYARLAAYAGVVWGIALLCAVLTLSGPPEGALLATLVGAAGLSLRSEPARMMLWRWEANSGRVFCLLAVEVLALAGILAGAMVVIALTRAAGGRLFPRLTWAGEQPESDSSSPAAAGRGHKANRLPQMIGAGLLEIAVALTLLVYTFRSTDRGQIAFALAASFFVGALAAHWAFPIRSSIPFWLGPILMAVVVFALGSAGAKGSSGPAWYNVLIVARRIPLRAALPVDWLAWGGGGAVAGFWLSRRIRHARLFRKEPPGQTQSS